MSAVVFSAAISAFSAFSGEKQRKESMASQSKANYQNAEAIKRQANEDLRRGYTNVLQSGKELERRASDITGAMAGAGIAVESSVDLILNEAGSLIQDASFAVEELNYNYSTSIQSANNMEKLARSQEKSSNKKFLGLF